jgi:cell division protein ZapA
MRHYIARLHGGIQMNEVKRIKVVIAGETLTLISDEEEQYIQALASYIDTRITEIAQISDKGSIHPHTLSLLTAVNIADELFKERVGHNESIQNAEQHIKENERLRTLVDELWLTLEQTWNEMNSHKENLEKAQAQANEYKQKMDQAKKELEEYIEAFDTPRIKGVILPDSARKVY